MAVGECSAYSSLQADSKVKFSAWPTSWRPPGADRLWPRGTTVKWTFAYGWRRRRQHYKYRRGYYYYYYDNYSVRSAIWL